MLSYNLAYAEAVSSECKPSVTKLVRHVSKAIGRPVSRQTTDFTVDGGRPGLAGSTLTTFSFTDSVSVVVRTLGQERCGLLRITMSAQNPKLRINASLPLAEAEKVCANRIKRLLKSTIEAMDYGFDVNIPFFGPAEAESDLPGKLLIAFSSHGVLHTDDGYLDESSAYVTVRPSKKCEIVSLHLSLGG
jgi:hypothetical protein